MPFYRHIINPQIEFWSDPKDGRLVGQIIYVSEDGFNLEDMDGKVWTITNGKAQIEPRLIISEGERIKLIGEQIEKNIFNALRIMPIGPGRGCFENMQPGGCWHEPLPPMEFNLRILMPGERNFF